jgi:hypothetical protein
LNLAKIASGIRNGNVIVILVINEFKELIYQRSRVLIVNMCVKISRHVKFPKMLDWGL